MRVLIAAALIATLFAAPALHAQTGCRDTPDGRICTLRQPLISGTLIDTATQRQFGLITVTSPLGSCSGTLLNRHWVLTAAHCVTNDGRRGGTQLPASRLLVSAGWSPRAVRPTQIVNYFSSHRLDVALLALAAGDLGPADVQLLRVQQVERTQEVIQYGRGISGYAQAGPPRVPAVADGRYRSARFRVERASDRAIGVEVNVNGQIGAGGDSGGPIHLTGQGGVSLGIAGVTSGCNGTFLPGARDGDWTWVTEITDCEFAPLYLIRDDIVRRIQPRHPQIDQRQPQTTLPRGRTADELVTQPPGGLLRR